MKRYLFLLATIIIVMAFATAGCDCQKVDPLNGPVQKEYKEDEVIAWVNGIPIAKEQVDEMIASLPPQIQMQARTARGMKNLIENLVNVELVYQLAIKEGYMKRDDVKLKIFNITKQVVYSEYMQEAIEKASKVGDAEAEKFYNENPQLFVTVGQVRASHILFKVKEDGSNDSSQRDKCGKVIKLALASDADWNKLVKEYTEGEAKENGGDLGFFDPKMMAKPISTAAFKLNDNEISKECVKSHNGYHIIMKTGSKEGATRAFSEVKEELISMLSRKNQQTVYEEIVAKLKTDAEIKFNDKLMPADAPAAMPPGLQGMFGGDAPPAPPGK